MDHQTEAASDFRYQCVRAIVAVRMVRANLQQVVGLSITARVVHARR